MLKKLLVNQIKEKKSYLCVGLDTSLHKLPGHLRNSSQAIINFNKAIIDATKDLCVAYKINTAFYEAYGSKGWEIMEETVAYIPKEHFKIADAKRADIGNTSAQYAKAFFEHMNFDAVTVAPYMGEDSVRPFLEFEHKWAIVLGLTSNPGAADFELQKLYSTGKNEAVVAEFLYERIIKKVATWGNADNLMFVVGATQAEQFSNIRKIIPQHFLLVPGVGFQGGSLADISTHALTNEAGLLVNASRAIIYAGSGEDFAEEARNIAKQYQQEMEHYLTKIL